MPEPFLNLGDVGLVVEGVRRGRSPEGMDAEAGDVDAATGSVELHNAVADAGTGEGRNRAF